MERYSKTFDPMTGQAEIRQIDNPEPLRTNRAPAMLLASDDAATVAAKLGQAREGYADEQDRESYSADDELARETASVLRPKGSSGTRVNVRARIAGLPLHVREQLEHDLCSVFGGFTRSDDVGGWCDEETGETMVEPVYTYDVSFKVPGHSSLVFAKALFCDAGRRAGEKWVHLEVSRFQAMHAKVN